MSERVSSFPSIPLPAFLSRRTRDPLPDLESGLELNEVTDDSRHNGDSFRRVNRFEQETIAESSRMGAEREEAEKNNKANGKQTKEITVRDKRTHLAKIDHDKALVRKGKRSEPRNDDEEGYYSNFFPAAGFNANPDVAKEYRQHRLKTWDPENYQEPASELSKKRGNLEVPVLRILDRINRDLFVDVPPHIYENLMSQMPGGMVKNVRNGAAASRVADAINQANGKAKQSEEDNDDDPLFLDENGVLRAAMNPFFQEKPEVMIRHEIENLSPDMDMDEIANNIKPMKSVQDWLEKHPDTGSSTGVSNNPEQHIRSRAQIKEMAKNDPELQKELRDQKIRQFLGLVPTLLMGGLLGYTLIKVGNTYSSQDTKIPL